MNSTRILLVDDHALFCDMLTLVLESQQDFKVVGQTARAEDVFSLVATLRPDVVIMDVMLPEMDGIEATKRLHHKYPAVKVLAFSSSKETVHICQMLSAGAQGYLLKRTPAEEIIRAVRSVAEGDKYLDPNITGTLDGGLESGHLVPGAKPLTGRERVVLQFSARGFLNKEIAYMLDLQPKTVETSKKSGKEKLGLNTRSDLINCALALEWLKSETIR